MRISKELQARIDLLQAMFEHEKAMATIWRKDGEKAEGEKKATYLEFAKVTAYRAQGLEDCIRILTTQTAYKTMKEIYMDTTYDHTKGE